MVCITAWPLAIFAFPLLSPRRSHPFHGFSFILYTEHTTKYYPKPLLCVWETSYHYYLSNIYTYIWMSPMPFKAPMSKSELMIFFFGNGLQNVVQISISWVLVKKGIVSNTKRIPMNFIEDIFQTIFLSIIFLLTNLHDRPLLILYWLLKLSLLMQKIITLWTHSKYHCKAQYYLQYSFIYSLFSKSWTHSNEIQTNRPLVLWNLQSNTGKTTNKYVYK